MILKLFILSLFILSAFSILFYFKKRNNHSNTTHIHGHSGELKILTWNIFMLPYCSIIHGSLTRARAIADKLANSDYDIIVFQEAFNFRARGILKRLLEKSYPFMYGPVNQPVLSLGTSSGIWIISKIPLKYVDAFRFKNRYGIDAMARKGAAMFEGIWDGQLFQLVGTHLQANSPDNFRRNQCIEIAYFLKKYAKLNVPQIVCGDFNIEMADADNYQFMMQTLEVQNGSLEGHIQVSYDEVENKLAFQPNGKRQMIDYILLRNAHVVDRIKRGIAVIRSMEKDKLLELSDHYAVEASILFNTPSQIAFTE